MKTQTTTIPAATSTALVVWNAQSEQHVRQLIAKGATVPKAYREAAPKGFLAPIRLARQQELMGNSAFLMAQIQEEQFRIGKMSEVKTLKNGVKLLNVQFRTEVPESNMTMDEFAKANNVTVEDLRALLSAKK